MNTIKCAKCGSIYPQTDSVCPTCASATKNLRDSRKRNQADAGQAGGVITFIVIMFFVILFVINGGCSEDSSDRVPETRKDKIEKQFSAWNGSHRDLVRRVKRVMRDPDSFEHIETRYSDQSEGIYVFMDFRGANAFGGKTINRATAIYAVSGELISGPDISPL